MRYGMDNVENNQKLSMFLYNIVLKNHVLTAVLIIFYFNNKICVHCFQSCQACFEPWRWLKPLKSPARA